MSPEQIAKIDAGVMTCLQECRSADRPYTRLSAFLKSLKNTGWADDEIIELQTRVIRVLLYQRDHNGMIGESHGPTQAD